MKKINSRTSRKLKVGFAGKGTHKWDHVGEYGQLTDRTTDKRIKKISEKESHYNAQVQTIKQIGLLGRHPGSKTLSSIKHQLREYNKAVAVKTN